MRRGRLGRCAGVVICGWLLEWRCLRATLVQSARQATGGGGVARRLPVSSNDELGRLAGSFNELVGELDQTLKSLAGERDRLETILEGMTEALLALDRDDRVYLPAHGPAITEPQAFARSLIDHRLEREQQILDGVAQGRQRIAEDMVPVMYANVPAYLHGAAARSVFAHVLHLLERGQLACEAETPSLKARYRLR